MRADNSADAATKRSWLHLCRGLRANEAIVGLFNKGTVKLGEGIQAGLENHRNRALGDAEEMGRASLTAALADDIEEYQHLLLQ